MERFVLLHVPIQLMEAPLKWEGAGTSESEVDEIVVLMELRSQVALKPLQKHKPMHSITFTSTRSWRATNQRGPFASESELPACST